jgi:outer membrane lipopolysaccharide assembly protein LptE/RlpB
VVRFLIRTVGLLVWVALLDGCGYRLANKNLGGGDGQTIAVPTFANKTTTYRIEQRMTEAVRQELIRRTRFNVVPDSGGDLLMTGEVLSYAAVPVSFNQQGRGSTYTMVVDMNIRLTETKTGKVVFQNDHWSFREIFELSQSSSEFVPEDPAALERLARRFASSFVASVMHSK